MLRLLERLTTISHILPWPANPFSPRLSRPFARLVLWSLRAARPQAWTQPSIPACSPAWLPQRWASAPRLGGLPSSLPVAVAQPSSRLASQTDVAQPREVPSQPGCEPALGLLSR